MPLMRCSKNGKPGYKWGESGKCYTYETGNAASREAAKAMAKRQARAIYASGYEEG